jgi:hypothetical protein
MNRVVLMQIDFEHDERTQRKRKLKKEKQRKEESEDDNRRRTEEGRGKAPIDRQRLKIPSSTI